MDATIIYYSSNREDPAFEAKIQANLLATCGGLPIVSVTHQPTDLGRNICVGDVGVSGYNMFRQVLIACYACASKYVISAEADTLYPPEYFLFRPPEIDVCYRVRNLYVMPDRRSFYFHKAEGATHAQIVGREFYIRTLERLFAGGPEWSPDERNFPKERCGQEDVFDQVELWTCGNPVVQIKTHRGMRYYTHSDRTPVMTLPWWGSGEAVRKEYIGDANRGAA
jgi:hypothetical protein